MAHFSGYQAILIVVLLVGGTNALSISRPRTLSPRVRQLFAHPHSSHLTHRLHQWLDKQECEGHEITYIGERDGLRGLFAKEPIESGEFIMALPFTATLLVGDSPSPAKYTSYDDEVRQGLAFLTGFASNPHYQAFVESLPALDSDQFDATPDFWDESVIAELQIRRLEQESLRRRDQIATLAKQVGVDMRQLQWAVWIVRSRGFTTLKLLSEPGGNATVDSRTVLLPLMDMVNHDPDCNAVLEVMEVPQAYDESFYALQAVRDIDEGDEITLSYGTGLETSLDLFSKYGFWATDNPADAHLDWSVVDPHWTTSLDEDQQALDQLPPDATRGQDMALRLRIHLKQLNQG